MTPATFHEFLDARVLTHWLDTNGNYADLARMLRVTPQALCRWTRGVGVPGPGMVLALAEILCVPPAEMAHRWTVAKAAREAVQRPNPARKVRWRP